MKVENHKNYTLAAVQIFEQYRNCKVGSERIAAALAESSEKEDNPLEMQRGSNWHFYNNGGLISNNKLLHGIRTSENRVTKLIDKITEEIVVFAKEPSESNAENLLNKMGRLLHHIQDMSTPSHVVPVYHGLSIKDQYEDYGSLLANKMNLVYCTENLAKDVGRWAVTINANDIYKALDLQASKEDKWFYNLYVDAAERTLQFLRDTKFVAHVDGVPQQFLWNAFYREFNDISEHVWSENNECKDFGSFGRMGNNFGKSCFVSNGNIYEIDSSVYLSLYKNMYKKSVVESVAALDYLNRHSKVLLFER